MLPAIKRSTQKHQRPRLVMTEFPTMLDLVIVKTKCRRTCRKLVDLFLVVEQSANNKRRKLVNIHTLADPDFNRLIARSSFDQLFTHSFALQRHREGRNQTEGNLFCVNLDPDALSA